MARFAPACQKPKGIGAVRFGGFATVLLPRAARMNPPVYVCLLPERTAPTRSYSHRMMRRLIEPSAGASGFWRRHGAAGDCDCHSMRLK